MMVEAPIGSRARARGRYLSFFETLSDLAARGVDVCILHASPPSGPLQRELGRLAKRASGVNMRRCPRVHLKIIVVDGKLLYLGSANLTGAGLGAKGAGRRNFELGIVTDSEFMLDAAQGRFDKIWRGRECGACTMRALCDKPLDTIVRVVARPRTRLPVLSRVPRLPRPPHQLSMPSATAVTGAANGNRRPAASMNSSVAASMSPKGTAKASSDASGPADITRASHSPTSTTQPSKQRPSRKRNA